MKKIFTFFLALVASVGTICASDTEFDGIWYNFDSGTLTAEVTFRGSKFDSYSNEYSGAIIIPSSVTYNDQTYSVTSIGNYAFYYCTGLTSVTIPNGVTYIGMCAFIGCSGLTSIEIPNSVTDIGSGAFSGCSDLTSVTIPSSVTSIGSKTFNGCSGLTSVTIPNSVTIIGEYAFQSCSGLKSVEIPNSVTSIGYMAFSDCASLTSVNIPNNIASIENASFYRCSSLKSIEIPNSVTSIGSSAFRGCISLKSVTINSNAIASRKYTTKSSIKDIFGAQVKEYHIGDGVISIGEYAFHSCSDLTSVTIANSVTSIGNSVFYGCTGLTSVTIGSGVTSIGSSVFRGCSSLTSIELPNSVTSIEKQTFYGCTDLTSIEISNSVTNIGDSAFYGCSSLKSANIPDNVTNFGERAFYGCSSFASVNIPKSVTSIGNDAFKDCSGLTSVHISDLSAWCAITFGTYYSNPLFYAHNIYLNEELMTDLVIPNDVTDIKYCAFLFCQSLTSVTIPSSVKSIGKWAFYGCTGLTSMTIPENLQSTGAYPFYGCENLKSVVWNAVNCSTYDDGQYVYPPFNGCENITSFTIGEKVETLPRGLCYGIKFSEIIIPNSVTSIGVSAFRNCTDLTSITIPNSVKNIGNYAFDGCTSLTDIYATCGDLERIKQMLKNDSRVKYEPLPYSISTIARNGSISTNITDITICDDPLITCTATPDYGYHFVQWSDGVKDNPRTIELTQDTTFTAEMAANTSGQCGDELYWTLADSILTITGTGDMWDEQPWVGSKEIIQQINLPLGITSIGEGAFKYCYRLTSIEIPNSVTSIGNNAFNNCYSLTSIEIPQNVTSIGTQVFNGSSLTSVVWAAKNYSAKSPFDDVKGQISSFVFRNTVEHIPSSLCNGMTLLTSIVIPKGCISIGDYAFSNNNNILSISLPSTLTTIGRWAFDSQKILNVYNYALTPQDMSSYSGSEHLFRGILADANLYVPQQVIETYRNTYYWCYFGNIQAVQTPEPTAIDYVEDENSSSSQVNESKILYNGQILILRGEKVYTVTGQEVR